MCRKDQFLVQGTLFLGKEKYARGLPWEVAVGEKGLDFHLFSRAALFRLVARLAGVSLVVQQRPAYLIPLAVPYFGGVDS